MLKRFVCDKTIYAFKWYAINRFRLYLNVNNCKINDSAAIPEHLNKYFCDSGKALADKIGFF